MIAHANDRTYRLRMSAADLHENEVRSDVAQGPVPACLRPGYEPEPVVVRLPDSEPLQAAPVRQERHAGNPARVKPGPKAATPADLASRKLAITAALSGGAWRTVRELARETELAPRAVRLTIQRMRLQSRAVPLDQMQHRDGLLEYALMGAQT